MAPKCKEIVQVLNNLAPFSLAEKWDNSGLLVGDPEAKIQGIILCLDVNEKVIAEALKQGSNLIISHHPLIFKPLTHLRANSKQVDLIYKLIKHDLQVIAFHTNFDSAGQGVNQQLAQLLGLEKIQLLQPIQEELIKIAVFVPAGYEDAVRDAMGEAGAGYIGNYSHCTFRSLGTGTFLPLEETNPFIGISGKLEEVQEYRLETIVQKDLLPEVIKNILRVHPYEEVAYDLYPVENKLVRHGLGRVGTLPRPLNLEQFAQLVKEKLKIKTVRVYGDKDQIITRVAICGGAGRSMLKTAAQLQAQVLLTGDLSYHDYQEAAELEIALLDAGHFATEIISLDYLKNYLAKELVSSSLGIKVVKSKDPWEFI
ncbi:Nif3-like dinuclear metal center hexameric protein [Bacillota bacterium LX-D]|nr:Nif3-like dinuclear metal center hexameric protein [Bacillota bacterium LX-D]